MEYHDEPIHKNNKGGNHHKKHRNEDAKSYPSEDGHTYGIDILNKVDAANTS